MPSVSPTRSCCREPRREDALTTRVGIDIQRQARRLYTRALAETHFAEADAPLHLLHARGTTRTAYTV